MNQWQPRLAKKQKTFKVLELCRIPKCERRQFVENSQQSINFVSSRKRDLVRNMAKLAPCYVEKDFIHPISMHGDHGRA
jgi:hypothetical protein